jgi:bidirectional [NiFe] hydrogenase diaphorase subunit
MPVRSRVKTFTINGQDVSGDENETILNIAEQNDIHIPTLCKLEGLSIVGACRLCVVEVAGWNKLVPACATYIEEGMEVTTNSERLQDYRRMIVEMLFAEGNHVCAVCISNGHCTLQDLAVEMGMTYVRYPRMHPDHTVDMSHDRFLMDPNRCVLCTRCVRVCDEIEGAHTWDVQGRGYKSRLITDLAKPWGESETCTSCSKCVHVCPTGAIVEKGKSIGEMVKERKFLTYLTTMRRTNHD